MQLNWRWILPVYFSVSGCTGHLYFDGENLAADPHPSTAYVENPQLQHEFKILNYSGLYQLVDQPNAETHIVLRPMQIMPGCGNPVAVSALTLGLIPASIPQTYFFTFDTMQHGKKQTHTYTLAMLYTYSFYESLYLFYNEDREMGNALRAAVHDARK